MSFNHRKLNRRRWEAARVEVLEAAGYRCAECGGSGRLEVDHIEALSDGGAAYDRANLRALCRSCHLAKGGYIPIKGRREWAERLRHAAK